MKNIKDKYLERIKDVEITYDYEDSYNKLYNIVVDYSNETGDYSIYYLFDEIVSFETVECLAKNELEEGGLLRLYYFLGNADMNNDIFRINGYGNVEDITKEDLEFLKDEIIVNLQA